MIVPRARPIRFVVLAAGFAGAALYHLAALTIPAFAKTAYAPSYPWWRHIVFIAIDVLVANLVLVRPGWLIWLYLVLTVQVIQGHGTRAWRTLFQQHRVNWIDAFTVLGVLFGLAVLYIDRRHTIQALTSARVLRQADQTRNQYIGDGGTDAGFEIVTGCGVAERSAGAVVADGDVVVIGREAIDVSGKR